MPIQNTSVPMVTIPSTTFEKLIKNNCELKELYKGAVIELKVSQQKCKILEDKNTALKIKNNDQLRCREIENRAQIQLIDKDLQSSKTSIQCIYAIAGAVLFGGATLAFPPVGAFAIGAATALGAGSAAVVASTAGAALAGGTVGGCLVAPFVHKTQHNALIQQVEDFQAQEAAEVNQISKPVISGNS